MKPFLIRVLRFFHDRFARIAMWQPKPHYPNVNFGVEETDPNVVTEDDNEPISRIFYKKVGSVSVQKRKIGLIWCYLFLDIAHWCLKKAIALEKKERQKKDLR